MSKRVVAAHYFEANLCGDLIRPGDPDYDEARTVWNGMIDRYPALIACPVTVEDVVAAVNFARENNILLAVRGGGHNVAGHATVDGGLVIDLSLMKDVLADDEANITWVREFINDMREFSDGSRYLNFAGFQEEGDEMMRKAFGPQ